MNNILTVHNIFYSTASIIVGLLLLLFGFYQLIKMKRRLIGILAIIHSILFIGFGVYGYFISKKYEFIVILAMLAFAITMIICLLLFFKKDKNN